MQCNTFLAKLKPRSVTAEFRCNKEKRYPTWEWEYKVYVLSYQVFVSAPAVLAMEGSVC